MGLPKIPYQNPLSPVFDNPEPPSRQHNARSQPPVSRPPHDSARRWQITTAFAVRGFGSYDVRYFEDVDCAFTCSQFLRVGIVAPQAIEPE